MCIRDRGGPGAGKQELQAAELHTVTSGGEMVDHQDMYGKAYGCLLYTSPRLGDDVEPLLDLIQQAAGISRESARMFHLEMWICLLYTSRCV